MQTLSLKNPGNDLSAKPSRRRLLKIAAGMPISLPVFKALASESSSTLSFHKVKNQFTAQGIKQGTIVLVDNNIQEFLGDGFYLYPDWGQPIVYEVKKRGNSLSFHYPGLERELWQVSVNHQNARFSGRVEGVLDANEQSHSGFESLAALDVPEFPIP